MNVISVAVIFDNLGPYHVARLRAASAVCQLTAIEVAGASAVYAWEKVASDGDFRRVTLLEQQTSVEVNCAEVVLRLRRALDEIRPAVVFVPGWASPAAWGAIAWCIENRAAMVVMSESTAWDEPRSAWKEWIKARLVGLFPSALVGGVRHRDYLVKLGMRADQIFFGYDAIDHVYFSHSVDAWRARGDEARREFGLPETYFLASARFVAKKNLARLIEAYAAYRRSAGTAAWPLVLLGDGELRGELEAKIASLELRDAVQMPGFRQYGDLPAYYAFAGAFVHASTVEPWGLVVNEAAAGGLPVLVSDRCGCVPELVKAEVNGFTFNPEKVDDMAAAMRRVAAPDFPRAAWGAKSREIGAKWGAARFADGLSGATEAALSRPAKATSPIDRAVLSLLLRR